MQTRFLLCVLGVGAIALSSTSLPAHGGIYRGPGDVVPDPPSTGKTPRPGGPRGNPNGPRTGRPSGPSAPAPSGPSTGGGPGGPGGGNPRGPTTRRGGIEIGPDLSMWTFWWEFNKHAYLGLRENVHQSGPTTGEEEIWMGPGRRHDARNLLEPTRSQIRDQILPALKRAIDATEQRDIVSSCMVAMAKIGEDHPDFRLVDVFRPRLQRGDQEIRETAALALGIAAVHGNGAFDLLIDLALDNDPGRKAHGGEVRVRTRAFALYALGLFASEHSNPTVKQQALTTMHVLLTDQKLRNRNLKVAAIHGIGMLNIDRVDRGSEAMLDEAVQALLDYYLLDLGPGEQLIQAHCPSAITKLLGRDHARSGEFRQRFADELAGRNRSGRRSHDLARSCVLALGQLCGAYDDKDSADADCSKLLIEVSGEHKDAQTRYFSLLSLGQIGGVKNRDFLLRTLRRGNKSLERPWAALALGLQSFASYRAQEAATEGSVRLDDVIGDALIEQLATAKQPVLVGALGVALGLNRCIEAAGAMRELVRSSPEKEEQAGYLCIGLALMRDRGSIETIRDTLLSSQRRTHLFVQSAIALGVLGDKAAAESLQDKFTDEHSNLATLSAIAEALGQIGDRRSVEPLTKALFDEQRGDLQRAFAAVALGAVADRAMLPWHAKISTNINYRAAVETLTNQMSGVLDIL